MNFKLELTKVDHEKDSVTVNGMKMTVSYFTGIVLPTMLNGMHSADAAMVELCEVLQDHGFNLNQTVGPDAAKHFQYLKDAEAIKLRERQKLAADAAARCHVDTPEEIAAYHAEKKAKQARIAAQLRGSRVGGGHF